MFSGLFPSLAAERESEAVQIYHAIFGDLPISSWTRQGTLITRFVNGRKLNFAARRYHCTIGFRGHSAIEFYRFIGGACPVGEVTIQIPYGTDWDPGLVAETIEWYFNN